MYTDVTRCTCLILQNMLKNEEHHKRKLLTYTLSIAAVLLNRTLCTSKRYRYTYV